MSVADVFRAIEDLPVELASERSRDRLAQLAARVPGVGPLFGFECRLSPDEDIVDLGIGVAGSADLLAPSGASAPDDRWSRIASFARCWRSEPALEDWIPFVFLEYDADAGDDVPVPSLFAALDSPLETGTGFAPELCAVLRTVALLGDEPHPATATALTKAHEELPPGSRWLHVGVMLGRNHAGVRLSVAIDGADVRAYLERLGAPAAATAADAACARFGARLARAQLDFDLGVEAGARDVVGFGLVPGKPDRGDWQTLLDEIGSRTELCARKAAALLRWSDAGNGAEPPGPAASRRRLSHLKLVCGPTAPPTVKAYLEIATSGCLGAEIERDSPAPLARR